MKSTADFSLLKYALIRRIFYKFFFVFFFLVILKNLSCTVQLLGQVQYWNKQYVLDLLAPWIKKINK